MELAFDRRGSGEPLVLVHGIGCRWQYFEPVLDLLASDFEVWAVDMPGFGASAPLSERTDIAALTDAIQQWMAEQGIEGGHVAGHSTGGGVALELASRTAIASCCALAPIGFWSTRERMFGQASVRNARAISRLVRPVAPALIANPLLRAALFSQAKAHPMRVDPATGLEDLDALIAAPAFDDVCDAFAGYLAPADAADSVPVTIAWGDKDRLLLPRQGRRARNVLPRARHVIVPGAGHVMMADEPEAVAAVIREATRVPAFSPVGAPSSV